MKALDPRERASILNDLASADEEVRRLAVERVGLLPAGEALPLLAERLGDSSWRVRKSAVECLAAAPEDWPVAPRLIAALADGEDPGRRNAAVEALVRIGRRVVEPLLAALDSPDVDVRKLVVDVLAGIGSEQSVPRLVALLRDSDANVRGAVADALGAIGGAAAARALAEVALRPDEEMLVRFSALRALARAEAPLGATELASALGDPLLRPVAFGVLGHGDDPQGIEELLKGLAAGSRASREAAVEALLRVAGRQDPGEAERLLGRIRDAARSSRAAVGDAVERLGSADLGTRLLLAQFLGIVRPVEAVLPLLEAAQDEALSEVALGALAGFGEEAERIVEQRWDALGVEARALACEAIGRTEGPCGAARLVAALDDADPMVRIAAALALARRADPAALPALVRRLGATSGDGEPEAEEERDAATAALVRIATAAGDAESRGAVLALLGDASEGAEEPVRLAIARVLREAGGPEHVEWMALLVQDASSAVRRAAVAALARMGADATSEWLRLALADEDAAVRASAAMAFGESGDPRALPDLERLLADEDAAVRAAAVRAVAELGCRAPASEDVVAAAERLLGAALADVGPVAIAAVEACERLGQPLSLEPVYAVLSHGDPEVVQSAVHCLRRHASESDLPRLIPLLGHPQWAVRADVIEAFGERRLRSALPAVLRRLDVEQDEFVREVLLRTLTRLEEA